MTDRATGSYTHDRLIALEDSHEALARTLSVLIHHITSRDSEWGTVLRLAGDCLVLVEQAKKIRKEAWL